jgi:uncharacterized protein
VVPVAVGGLGYRNALAPPVERRLNLSVRDFPRDRPRLRLVLLSDVHVHGPDMPPSRLRQIVERINQERPDIVVAAGDFIGNNWIGAQYSPAEAVAPLAKLNAPLGVFAVLGNNDHLVGGATMTRPLEAAHVKVLENEALRVGPIILGGVDYRVDRPPQRALQALHSTLARMEPMKGPKVLVAHSPDLFPSVPPGISLVLAGHTHCGQIALPVYGALLTGSRFGRRFECGLYRDGNRVLVVTAGLGTSHVPIRFAAPPDYWVIDMKG